MGAVAFTDFVSKNKSAMETALATLSIASTDHVVTVEQGDSVAFGVKNT